MYQSKHHNVLVRCGGRFGAAAALLGGVSAADAQFTFDKIADTDTTVPGNGGGTFNNFLSSDIVIDQQQVAFRGIAASGNEGVYLFDGATLSEVAFVGDPVAGLPTLDYIGFDEPKIHVDGAGVATVGFEGFFRNGRALSEVAVTNTAGVATNRADTVSTINPSTAEVFESVNQPGIDGPMIVFVNASDFFGGEGNGVYTETGGVITTVVDRSDAVPGLPGFSFDTFDGDVAFNGSIGIQAVITDDVVDDRIVLLATPGGSLTSVADTVNTLSPSTGITFDEVDEPGVDGSNVAFHGSDDNGFGGIYTNLTGPLTTVADQATLVPGQGLLTFTAFDDDKVSIDGLRIAFEGEYDGGEGLYLWDNGLLLRILDDTQILDGKVISTLDLAFDSALSGDTVVFHAGFTNGTEGIFTATIPEPGTIALLAAGLPLLACRRRSTASTA